MAAGLRESYVVGTKPIPSSSWIRYFGLHKLHALASDLVTNGMTIAAGSRKLIEIKLATSIVQFA